MTDAPNITCAAGGNVYACGDGSRFVGCCLTNPCSNGCPAGNLRPMTFDPVQYGTFSDQQCDAGAFYTCSASSFVGCCSSENACASTTGCPSTSLAGAFLSANPNTAQDFLTLNTTWTTPSIPTSNSTPIDVPDHPHTNLGAIIGGSVGGFAVLAIICGFVFVVRRRRRATRTTNASNTDQAKNGDCNPTQITISSPKKYSPITPFEVSPRPVYSPGPPGYAAEMEALSVVHELHSSPAGLGINMAAIEMDSGQYYQFCRDPTPMEQIPAKHHCSPSYDGARSPHLQAGDRFTGAMLQDPAAQGSGTRSVAEKRERMSSWDYQQQ